MSRDETYLGDGCYISYDGWQIKLRAPRDYGDHVVYLDATLMHNLLKFAQDVGVITARAAVD